MQNRVHGLQHLLIAALFGALAVRAETVSVDANANRHAIDPRVYGIAYGDATTLPDLNVPVNRLGGNNTSRYNWLQNADNRGSDWYFESIGDSSSVAGERGDSFFTMSKNAGAQAMMTIPMVGYVAKLGTNRAKLCSFSQAKYGAQQDADWSWFSDAGNGVLTSGQNVTNNNPLDANVAADSTFQKAWVQHFVSTFGGANAGGLKYYILDNEHSIWQGTHRDVHPVGPTMDEIKTKMVDYATMIKSVDGNALIVGPEEWGWSGYLYSGYDQQYGAAHGWSSFPDRAAHGNMDYMPWLLDQMKQASNTAGKRLLDVFTLHYYPQGGEFSDDTSASMQSRRNRSTRSLWDPNYVDETWIGTQVKLIPRMKGWVNSYYPGTQTGITEYNWGAESHINGATAQADVYGIFGREGLDVGARWTTPASNTPTYKAMKMYRNYDGNKSTFGDQSCTASVTNPDNLSAFSAIRASDGAMTVMVINKVTSSSALTLNLANFTAGTSAKVWQLTSSNAITNLANLTVSGNSLSTTVPAQSITLFVIPTSGPANQAPTVATAAAASPSPVTGMTTNLSVLGADDAGEAALVYTWATTGTPPAAVTFSANGTNAAKNSTASFSKAGAYSFQVTIKDAGNLTVTSSVNVTVNQTLTSIALSPASASINVSATQQFSATAKDQFTNALSSQPTFTWSVPTGGGSVNASGLYTAPGTTGSATVRAASGAVNGNANVTINPVNQAPTVATAASATPNPVTGLTTNLSVLGADDAGEAALVYTWATTGTPPAAVTFSANSTNAAKNSTATFTKAGAYSFQVTIKDAGNLTVTSNVNVTVNATLSTIVVSPPTANLNTGATQQFSAVARDQFGTNLATQPSFAWSANGGGTISASGLFTATTAGGPFTVSAASGGKSGTASVTVSAPPAFTVTITRVATGKPYALGIARPGEHQYVDRSYTISSLSNTLNGAIMIRQANDDKYVSAASNLFFTISTDATVYVCYDRRMKTLPAWLSGWTLSGESFATTDNAASPMLVYSKAFPAGSVTLGGNMQSPASGTKANYVPIIVPPPTASSSGAIAAASAPSTWSHDTDSDGDGLVDAFELAFGLDPNNPDVGNTGTPDETKTASSGEDYWDLQVAWLASQNGGNGGSSNGSTTPKTPMTLKHVSGSLNFATNIDACTASGAIPNITGPLSLAGATVHVEIGGAAVDFTLAKIGRAKTAEGSIRLGTKPKAGALPFTVAVKKPMPTLHADPQASPAAAKTKGTLNVTCDLTFGGTVYIATVQSKCSTSATKAAFKY
jgi:hypothetical protein